MQFVKITAVLAALTTLAVGSAAPAGLNITAPMKWIGPSKDVNITLYGTASEIITQLKALDPDWIPMSQRPGYVAKNTTSRSVALESRSQTNLFCCPVSGQNFVTVSANAIQRSAQDLIDAGGVCITTPNSCGLATGCNNGAGIWLCNDTPTTTIGANCADVGNYADTILDNCLGVGSSGGTFVCGQVFDSEGYNVILNGC